MDPSDENLSLFLKRQIENSLLHPQESLNLVGESSRIVGKEGVQPVETPSNETLLKKIHKLESLLNLYSDLYQQSGQANKIDTVAEISEKRFFEAYYFRNRPVILTGMMVNWPAMKLWSPDYFLQHYKDVPVKITQGREKDAAYEKNFHNTVATVPFGEFIRLIKEQPNNDLYIVARNYFFSNPEFHALQGHIIPPAEIIDVNYAGQQNMKLWFGPSGTLTPLHHDKHSILFCQVYGRKQFKMIPSFDLPKIYNTDRYYSEVDPENIDVERHSDFLSASVADVIVNPGDMLFIPAGWWHWVKSLDMSISVTFSNFRVPGFNTPWNCV